MTDDHLGRAWLLLMSLTFVGVIAHGIVIRVLVNRLRSVSEPTWRFLGKPEGTVVESFDLQNFGLSWAMTRYLLSGEHRRLGDDLISRMVWAARLLRFGVPAMWLSVIALWLINLQLRG